MKKILVAMVLILGSFTLNAQTTLAPVEITKVLKFTNDNYDMGKITTGKATEFNVTIENISATAITIDNVMVGCGCTTPKYNKGQVIAPGGKAVVTLGFNGSALGAFTKNATLFFSGNLNKQVSFQGEGVQP